MLEEISSSWYRNALGSTTMSPNPDNAFFLCCTKSASFLEVIGARCVPSCFDRHGVEAFNGKLLVFFRIAWYNVDSLLATLLKVVGLVEEEVGG
jgi:hypothetical protein